MKILITCPRAPISVEWVKIALKAGHDVILVDSLDYPIGIFYKETTYIKVPSPRIDFDGYKNSMLQLFDKVDLVIPNCEDIFYLSQVKDSVDVDCKFLMPDSNKLLQLHNKFEFFDSLNNQQIKFPKTKLITKTDEIDLNFNSVLKPVFSRFGANVVRTVNQDTIKNLYISKNYPWVQQQFIDGKPICNYAICDYGQVVSHTVYKPMYLLNKAAASYFRYIEDIRCDKFIQQFAKDNHYHGQIAFDFIDNGEFLYILECNPRATSGLHIVSDSLSISADGTIEYSNNISQDSYRVGMSLFLLFSFKALLKGEFLQLIKDHFRAKDVLDPLPWYGQFLSLYEMVKRSFIYKKSLTTASTFDIEYDGEANG